jgi:hypothetical protein
MSNEQMTVEEHAIVKLAAAQRYKERNIRPATADYLMNRFLDKKAGCAKPAAPKAKPAPKAEPAVKVAKPVAKPAVKKAAVKQPDMGKITKLASNLKKVLAKQ